MNPRLQLALSLSLSTAALLISFASWALFLSLETVQNEAKGDLLHCKRAKPLSKVFPFKL
jgi:hypothetical protein